MAQQSSPKNGPQLTWINVLATIAVFFTAAGGSYALIQQQFGALERQFANEIHHNSEDVKDLRTDLDHLRKNIVERREYEEMVRRVDEITSVIRDQLRVIETTRPTTGELQAIATTTSREIMEIKSRLQSIEDYNRRPQALAPVTPPH